MSLIRWRAALICPSPPRWWRCHLSVTRKRTAAITSHSGFLCMTMHCAITGPRYDGDQASGPSFRLLRIKTSGNHAQLFVSDRSSISTGACLPLGHAAGYRMRIRAFGQRLVQEWLCRPGMLSALRMSADPGFDRCGARRPVIRRGDQHMSAVLHQRCRLIATAAVHSRSRAGSA